MTRDARSRGRQLALAAAGSAALGTAATGEWLRRRGARRSAARMAAALDAIDESRLGERVAVPPGGGPSADLASALNALLDRLELGVAERRWRIAEASHEMRTPLTAIKAELDVSLRADELPSELREVVQELRDQVDRTAQTLDNVLRLARGEDAYLELALAPVELCQAIESALRSLHPLAHAKELTLAFDGCPCETQADPYRLHQALTNLIENAIKFSPSGGEVRVSAWRRDDYVGVTVVDEGPGIPAEAREQVFDRFFRVGDERAREAEGSGLGLAICREIATAHGGAVWVDSESERGNAISLALPGERRAETSSRG